VISQAQATLGALMSQRSTFGGITTKISNVSSRIPTVCIVYAYWKQPSRSMSSYVVGLMIFPTKPVR
jgi:Golgi SNAP receptor complex protein 1